MERFFFTSESPGKAIRIRKGRWAFYPDPLPSEINQDWQISEALAEAERGVGRFEGQLAGLMNLHKTFRNIFLFQGAFAAFTLENTKIFTEDHFLSLMSEGDLGNASSYPISLYCNAYDAGLEYLDKNLPPSLDLILQIYQQIFQSDTVSKGAQRGFREKAGDPPNLFGLSGEEFQYIPPPESLIKTALYSFDKRFRQEAKLPILVDISLIFYQFMAIQPLSGGNMATACLLTDLLLAASLETKSIPVSVAPFISKNKEDCANRFLHLVKTGDWAEWISFFLKGMAGEFGKARQTVSNVTALREDYRKRLESERVSAALAQLADDILINPVITVNYASKLARVTFRAAQLNVDKLLDLGILTETTGQRRNRIYTAPDVLQIYGN